MAEWMLILTTMGARVSHADAYGTRPSKPRRRTGLALFAFALVAIAGAIALAGGSTTSHARAPATLDAGVERMLFERPDDAVIRGVAAHVDKMSR